MMQGSLLRSLGTFGIVCWVLGGVAFAASPRERLESLKNRAGRLNSSLRLLRQSYRGQRTEGRVSLQKRLSDGQVNFLLRDYVSASVILLDAVETPENRGRSGWLEANFYLAESLFKNGNYISATKYYQRIVEARHRRFADALTRLLEIASVTRKYDWINSKMSSVSLDSLPQEKRAKILYLQGKTFYAQDRFSTASQFFQRIPQGSPFWSQGQYFLAVVQLKTAPHPQNIDNAIQFLKAGMGGISSSQRNGKTRQQALYDTILIALGRLYLEKNDYRSALEYYQQIGRRSKVFDEALYEICWTYIRRGRDYKDKKKQVREYDRALKSLNLLLDFLPNSTFYSQAQLLRGQLLLELNRFSPAMEGYNKIVKQYSSVYRELDQIKKNRLDVEKELLRAVSEKKRARNALVSNSLLPREAVQTLTEDEQIQRVIAVQRDLSQMQSFMADSMRIVQRLERALRVQERILISPELRQARLQSLTLQNQLISLQEESNSLEQSLVLDKMSSSERTRYEELLRQLKAYQKQTQNAPKTAESINQRSKAFQERAERMAVRLHKVTIALNQLEREQRAAQKWLQRSKDARLLSPQAQTDVQTELTWIDKEITVLRDIKRKLQRELELARIELGYATDPRELKAQSKYRQLLAQQRALLAGVQSRLDGEASQIVSELQSINEQLRRSQEELNTFMRQLNGNILRYTRQVRARLQGEKSKLLRYEQQMNALQSEASQLSRAIIYEGFEGVKKRFYQLILRADVGVIDVVWKEKQTLQTKSQKVTRERNSELRVLDSEFRDLLDEVK
ncbi:MAG: hypothetical protein H6727_01585 [Myxococcales bacterium]|nr:hypothetical protein [Myxococcales bacterium]